jgi:hypothetical protein
MTRHGGWFNTPKIWLVLLAGAGVATLIILYALGHSAGSSLYYQNGLRAGQSEAFQQGEFDAGVSAGPSYSAAQVARNYCRVVLDSDDLGAGDTSAEHAQWVSGCAAAFNE